MRIACILVAAGSASRFGAATPKQFLSLGGVPVIRHAALALASYASLLQPVGDAAPIDAALAGIAHLPTVAGGLTRQDSVRAGLEALVAHAPDLVLVHDAARPHIPPGTIEALTAALGAHDGAIPALPVSDTLKQAGAGGVPMESGRHSPRPGLAVIARTVPREGLYRAQTPQAFRFEVLLALHRAGGDAGVTDDASLLERAGRPVALVAGSEANVKITYPDDLARMQAALLQSPRIGSGFDVHAFAPDRRLWLCGVEVAHSHGLAGHSDADVGLHALCDAIYGALAEGDIGRHFPPSDMQWRDADSADFVRHAAGRIAARGGRLGNADVTLICELPKITPHAAAMIVRVAELLGVDPSLVSVKATTTERLGFTGRGEGIAAQASVLVLLP